MPGKSCTLSISAPAARDAARGLCIALVLGILSWGFGGEHPLFLSIGAALVAALGTVRGARPGPAAADGQSGPRPWIAPLGVLTILAAASVVVSADLQTSLNAAMLCVVLWIVFSMAGSSNGCIGIAGGIVSVVTALSIYGFCQFMGGATRDFWHNGLFATRFINSAHFASLAAAALPLSVGLLFSGSRGAVVLGSVSLPVNVVALLLTESRAGWALGAAAALVLCGVAAVRSGPRRMPRGAGWKVCIGIVAAVAFAAVLWAVFGERVTARIAALPGAGWHAVAYRLKVWQNALRMIGRYPLGVGAGCFGERYLAIKAEADRAVALRAHCEPLQIVAELGCLAAPVLAWFAVALGVDILRRLGARSTPLWDWCLCASVGVYLGHSLVDFPLRIAANAFVFAALLGLLARRGTNPTEGRGPSPSPRKSSSGFAWRAACGVALVFWSASIPGQVSRTAGRKAMVTADFAVAEPRLRAAQRLLPWDASVANDLGRIAYARSLFAPLPGKRAYQAESLRQFRRSARLADTRAMTHVRRAWVLTDMGRVPEAEGAHLRAIACDPGFGVLHAYYADFLVEQNCPAEAADAYRAAYSAFHDSAQMEPARVFDKLYKASRDPALLRRACPPGDARFEAALERFLRRKSP